MIDFCFAELSNTIECYDCSSERTTNCGSKDFDPYNTEIERGCKYCKVIIALFSLVEKRIILHRSMVLPQDAMHSADYAIARCPCLRLSVRSSIQQTPVFYRNAQTYDQTFFHHRVTIHNKWYGNIPTGTPLTGASNAGDIKKSRFSANISLYIRY